MKLRWIGLGFDQTPNLPQTPKDEELHTRVERVYDDLALYRKDPFMVAGDGKDGFSAKWYRLERQPPLDLMIDIFDKWGWRIGFGLATHRPEAPPEALETMKQFLRLENLEDITLWEWSPEDETPPQRIPQ